MVHRQELPLIFSFGVDGSKVNEPNPLTGQWDQYDVVLDEAGVIEAADVLAPVPMHALAFVPVALMGWSAATVAILEAAWIYEILVPAPTAMPAPVPMPVTAMPVPTWSVGCNAAIDAFVQVRVPIPALPPIDSVILADCEAIVASLGAWPNAPEHADASVCRHSHENMDVTGNVVGCLV